MKTIKILILIITILITFSCSLKETIYDLATPESSIKSAADVDNALIGVYSNINNIGNFGRDIMWLTHSSADDLSSTAGNEPGIIARRITLNSGFALYNNTWAKLYSGISDANGIFDYLDRLDLDASFEQKAESEAKFLRAFFYFNLVNLYGGVPLILKSVDASQDFYLSRNSVEEIYAQIFKDLKVAIAHLPNRTAQAIAEKGRATKQSAQGYMEKASLHYANYLDLNRRSSESGQYYQLAIDYANDVINSNEYHLVPNYATLWDVYQENVSAQEILFASINTRDAADPGNTGEGGLMVQFFAPTTLGGVTGTATHSGNGFYKVEPWFFQRYLQGDYIGDYRVEKTFLFSWTNRTTGKNITVYPFTPTQEWESQTYLQKYFDGAGNSNFSHENDFDLLRLSDVYLMKAEAENELHGPTAIALTAFNKVRERARMANGTQRTTPADLKPGMSKEDFRMKIFDERGLEFIGEYSRYFDLRRMRYKDNTRTMLKYQFDEYLPSLPQGLPKWQSRAWTTGLTEASNIAPYDLKYELFPIPANQTSINPNIEQNSGW